MTYKHIVSANFHDRRGALRWLLRGFEEKPEAAKAVHAVTAKGIVFCPSTSYEYGFGCSVVGWCESAVGHEQNPVLPENAVRVRFNPFGYFFVEETRVEVPACEELILLGDGSMYAVVAAGEKGAEKVASAA